MTADEIMACVRQGVAFGYGTVVLQAGEDPGIGGRLDGRPCPAHQGAKRRWRSRLSLGERTTTSWPRGGGRRRPLSAALRDFQPRAVRAHPSAASRPASDRIALLGALRPWATKWAAA